MPLENTPLVHSDFAGIAMIISAIGSAIAAIYSARAHARGLKIQEDVRKVEVATNSMHDKLIEATHLAAMLAGEKKGREVQKAESDAAAAASMKGREDLKAESDAAKTAASVIPAPPPQSTEKAS